MMPFGDHWEWRGFGQTDADFRSWFETLPLLYPPTPEPLIDQYLWTPACRHNVKLRGDALKFKRFLGREGVYEHWRESPAEMLPFPLTPEHVLELADLLGVSLPEPPLQSVDKAALLALIARAQPPVQVVTVLKRRRLARWLPTGVEQELVVEWTQLLSPRHLETVALEHDSLSALQAAHQQLWPLLISLRPMNYLQAIAMMRAEQTP